MEEKRGSELNCLYFVAQYLYFCKQKLMIFQTRKCSKIHFKVDFSAYCTALSPNGIKYGHYGKRYQEKEWQRVMYECELLMYFGFIVLAIVWKIQGLFVVNKWNNIHPVPQGI